MTSRFRLTVHVLKPPDELIKFVQPVDGDATFSLVWKLAQDRYHQNYSAGRNNDYYWKGLRDENGADIDMRDTVVDVFGPILDPNRHIIQVNQQPVYRDDTAPLDSHLRPAFPPPTPAQRQQINKRRSEFERYGDTLDTLDPNQPVESHEHLPAPARKDSDGFAIPTKINRPSATHAPASPTVSQDTYEHQLVETQRRPSSELGSPVNRASPSPLLETPPASSTASSQYSSLAAVPSAQKLRTRPRTPVDQESEASVTEVVDPISDDSQPRLSILAVKTPTQAKPSSSKKKMSLSDDRRASLVGRDLASTPSSSTPASAPRVTWSSSDHAKVVEGLAKGLTIHAIQNTYFPTRTNESVRYKVRKVRKEDSGIIAQRKAQLSANSLWTEDEELQFVRAIRKDQHWTTLHDNRFRDRSSDSVKAHYAEVRQRLETNDKEKSTQQRYEQQVKNGQPSTGPNEKFTQDEDDLLLACRIEQVEMKRAAREFFPLRPAEQVVHRATKLFHDANRAAAKSQSGRIEQSHSVESLFEHNTARRDRIAAKRPLALEFKRKSSEDRAQEFNASSQSKTRVNKDQENTETRRNKEADQLAFHNSIAKAQKESEKVKKRRLNDDLQRGDKYRQELVAWDQQAILDREAGRPEQAPPKRPLGSSIGSEVLTASQPHSLSQSKVSKPKLRRRSTGPGITDSLMEQAILCANDAVPASAPTYPINPAAWDDDTAAHGVTDTAVTASAPTHRINPAIWDDETETAECIRRADQRMREAAEMPPEQFWQQSNLQTMSEDQIINHMIEQGVKQSMREKEVLDAMSNAAIPPVASSAPARASNAVTVRPDDDDDSSSSSSSSSDESEDSRDGLDKYNEFFQASRKKRYEDAGLEAPTWDLV